MLKDASSVVSIDSKRSITIVEKLISNYLTLNKLSVAKSRSAINFGDYAYKEFLTKHKLNTLAINALLPFYAVKYFP